MKDWLTIFIASSLVLGTMGCTDPESTASADSMDEAGAETEPGKGDESMAPLGAGRCGTRSPGYDEARSREAEVSSMLPAYGGNIISVPVHWHAVHATSGEGLVERADAERQISGLNDAFSGAYGGVDTKIRFVLQGYTATASDEWFPLYEEGEANTYSETEWNMHRALISAVDPEFTKVEVLHVFSTRAHGFLGWVNLFPYQLDTTVDRWWDGVTVNYDTLQGFGVPPYDEGDTFVHEVGHWFGLQHTFEYGCDPGDFVADTPAAAEADFGCPDTPPDTCSDSAPDSTDNYMSYYDDACMTGFTHDQAMLMRGSYLLWRAPA